MCVPVVVHGRGFVLSGQPAFVAFAVCGDVHCMTLLQLLAVGHDGIVTSWGDAGGLSRVVGVSTTSVPVSRDRLGIEGNVHVVHLADAGHQVAASTSAAFLAEISMRSLRKMFIFPIKNYSYRINV